MKLTGSVRQIVAIVIRRVRDVSPLLLAAFAATQVSPLADAQQATPSFHNCVYPIFGTSAYQFLFSDSSSQYSTCDFVYKTSPSADHSPTDFALLGPSQTPPLGTSNELLPNGLFSFMNPYEHNNLPAGAVQSTVFVQKGYSQDGIYIVDDNKNDTTNPLPAVYSGLDVRVFNVPTTSSRFGIHIHLDQSNKGPAGTLYNLAIGAHAQNAVGIGLLDTGANSIGIQNMASGLFGEYQTDGTAAPSTLATIGKRIDHFTTGDVLQVLHQYSAMTGDLIHAEMAAGSGTFGGNFIKFLNNGKQEFRVDSQGDVYVPGLAAVSGTRFVCVDTTGKLISQTTPCSGN